MQAISPRLRTHKEADEERLSPIATRSNVATRQFPLEPDKYRTEFERDRDRILHSKAFRRIKYKTQVFVNPEGDHYITRLTHTLQVAQVARALASAMGLNEPLAEAIGLGHDVGHTPFGHSGEQALEPFFEDGWVHATQSLRIYDVLEPLNLTNDTRDGILRHPWKIVPGPSTPEALCVRYADRIAYLTHDVMDAIRAGVLKEQDLPTDVITNLGQPGSLWITTLIRSVVEYSAAKGTVEMDPEWFPIFDNLRNFMFEHVYHSLPQQRVAQAAVVVVTQLVEWYLAHPELIPATYVDNDAPLLRQVADYVSGMTDRFALQTHVNFFGPSEQAAILGLE